MSFTRRRGKVPNRKTPKRRAYKPRVKQLEDRSLMSATFGGSVLGGDGLDWSPFSQGAVFGLGLDAGLPASAAAETPAVGGQVSGARQQAVGFPAARGGSESAPSATRAPAGPAPMVPRFLPASALGPHVPVAPTAATTPGPAGTGVSSKSSNGGVRAELNGPLVVTQFGLNLSTQYVPVNADDDNKSAVTNGIPATRDFDKLNMTDPDTDLKAATITLPNTIPQNGTFTLGQSDLLTGKVTFWQDQKKQQAMPATWTNGDGTPLTFFIEGDANSAVDNDVAVIVTYKL